MQSAKLYQMSIGLIASAIVLAQAVNQAFRYCLALAMLQSGSVGARLLYSCR